MPLGEKQPTAQNTSTIQAPSFGSASYSFGTSAPVANAINTAQNQAGKGDYQAAINTLESVEGYVTATAPSIKNASQMGELASLRDQARTIKSSYQSTSSQLEAAQKAESARQAQLQAQGATTEQAALDRLFQALQPTAAETQLQALQTQAIQQQLAQANAPTEAPIARINPEIESALYGTIAGRIAQEAEEGRKQVLGDVTARRLLGSGLERESLDKLEKEKLRLLTEAGQFSAVKSAELGQSQADVDTRRRQVEQAASQFNIGILPELQNIRTGRALETIGTLGNQRQAVLNRQLEANRLQTEEGLTGRSQQISLFDILQRQAAEERKRKQGLFESILSPFARIGSAYGAGRLGIPANINF